MNGKTTKYNPLLATSNESIMPVFAPSNYKWGVDLVFPVFWRKERAKLQMNQIKLKENKYALDLKQVQLENKLSASMTNIGTMQEQLEVVAANVDRYQRLLEGETIRFDLGESSVFCSISGKKSTWKVASSKSKLLLHFAGKDYI